MTDASLQILLCLGGKGLQSVPAPQLFCALVLLQVLLACLLDMSCVQRGGSLVVLWMGLGWVLVASWANCDCDLNIL